jgi:hypothetical protein
MQSRNKYISLVKQQKLKEAKNPPEKLDEESEKEMHSIEETIPLSVLIVFRETALREVLPELKEAIKKAEQSKSSSSTVTSFFSWFSSSKDDNTAPAVKSGEDKDGKPVVLNMKKKSMFTGWFSSKKDKINALPEVKSPKKGGINTNSSNFFNNKDETSTVSSDTASTTTDEDDDSIMQSVEDRIRKIDEDSLSALSSFFALRLKVATNASLNISFENSPLAEITMNFAAAVEMRKNNVMVHADLGNINLKDLCSSKPFNQRVIEFLVDTTKQPKLLPASSTSNNKAKGDGFEGNNIGFDPQFGIDLSIVEEKLSVRVKSVPLIITWNHEFIAKLLKFFDNDDDIDEYDERMGVANTGRDAMTTTSRSEELTEADLKLAATNAKKGIVVIEVEIFAPKFIIPENPDFESRCLFIDAGHLSMKGEIDSSGMNLAIQLSNISIAMPMSPKEMLEGNIDSQLLMSYYLLKPFSVNIDVSNIDKSIALINIDGYITPSIQAEIDAEKIIRLIQVALLIVGTFTDKEKQRKQQEKTDKLIESKEAANDKGSSSLTSETPTGSKRIGSRRMSLFAAPTISRRRYKPSAPAAILEEPNHPESIDENEGKAEHYQDSSSNNKKKKAKGDGTDNAINLHFKITGLEFLLKITDSHSAVLNFSNLEFSLLDRMHDSLIQFHMNSIELIDSNRPSNFQQVISARSSASGKVGEQEQNHLLNVQFALIKDKLSPAYNGYQSELEILIADIDIILDPFTTVSYKYLIQDLVSQYTKYFEQNRALEQELIEFSQQQQQQQQQQQGSGGRGGGDQQQDQQIIPSIHQPKGMKLQLKLNKVEALFLDRISHTQNELEISFSFHANSLVVGLTQEASGLMSGQVSLSTIELEDTRLKNQELFYKKIISRSNVHSKGAEDMALQVTQSEGKVKEGKNQGNDPVSYRLVEVKLSQQTLSSTMIEVAVRNLNTTIAIDILVDFIDLLMKNINSVVEILSKVELPDAAKQKDGKGGRGKSGQLFLEHRYQPRSSSSSSSSGYNKNDPAPPLRRRAISAPSGPVNGEHPSVTLERIDEESGFVDDSEQLLICLSLIDPNLVLLEDPKNEKSKAIAATCAITLQYMKDSKKHLPGDSKDTLHVSIQDAEIFVMLDNSSGERSHRIIEPTAFQLHLNQQIMSNIPLLLDVSFCAEDIFIRASLNDIVLTTKIVKRLTDRPDPGFAEMQDVSVRDKSAGKTTSSTAFTTANEKQQQLQQEQEQGSSTLNTSDSGSGKNDQQNQQKQGIQQQQLTIYRVRAVLSKTQVVLINDYNGQNNPLIKLEAIQTDFSLNGAVVDLVGEGHVDLFGDYYNSDLALWEPIFERWRPVIRLESSTMGGKGGKELKVWSDNMIQINVTGKYHSFLCFFLHCSQLFLSFLAFSTSFHTYSSIVFLSHLFFRFCSIGMLIHTISNAMNLVKRIDEEGMYGSRGESHPLKIRNELGIPIEIIDEETGESLVTLEDDTVTKLPSIDPKDLRKHPMKLARETEFERSFTLKFKNENENQQDRKDEEGKSEGLVHKKQNEGGEGSPTPGAEEVYRPVKGLRLDINKPKICQILPANQRASAMQRTNSNYAPVVEHVYEYQRYHLPKLSWGTPWINLGEPYHWSCAFGKEERKPNNVKLPEGWEWLENEWKVDLSGNVGKEIDKEGWEYSLRFNFGLNTKKRSQQPGDCCRRRKWMRTRYYKIDKEGSGKQNGGLLASLTGGRIVWQVNSNPDETKEILIRSTKTVLNKLTYGIEIGFESCFNQDGACTGSFKVYPNTECCLPIHFADESGTLFALSLLLSCYSVVFSASLIFLLCVFGLFLSFPCFRYSYSFIICIRMSMV